MSEELYLRQVDTRPLPRSLTEVLSDIGWSIKTTWESLFDFSNLVLIHQDFVWNGLIISPCSPDAQPNVSQNLGQVPGEGSILRLQFHFLNLY